MNYKHEIKELGIINTGNIYRNLNVMELTERALRINDGGLYFPIPEHFLFGRESIREGRPMTDSLWIRSPYMTK